MFVTAVFDLPSSQQTHASRTKKIVGQLLERRLPVPRRQVRRGAAAAKQRLVRRSFLAIAQPVKQQKLKDRDLVFILRNLATLTESGVSLPKALGTLAEEKALEKHREMLQSIRRHLENGETFSAALAHFGATFDTVMVNQIKVGEHSGTLSETLTTIARHREESQSAAFGNHSSKMAYPVLLVVMGSGGDYVLADVRHPGVRGDVREGACCAAVHYAAVDRSRRSATKSYGWIVLGLDCRDGVSSCGQLRKRADLAYKMDANILRMPVFGNWLRDIAVLQLMEVLGSLMDAGYTLAEALGEAAQAVRNRAIRQERPRPAERGPPRREIQPRAGTAWRDISADRQPTGDRRRANGHAHQGHQPHSRPSAARD